LFLLLDEVGAADEAAGAFVAEGEEQLEHGGGNILRRVLVGVVVANLGGKKVMAIRSLMSFCSYPSTIRGLQALTLYNVSLQCSKMISHVNPLPSSVRFTCRTYEVLHILFHNRYKTHTTVNKGCDAHQ